MITLLLIFVPLAAAVLAYSAKNMRKVIRLILLAGAALHSMLTLLAFTMLDTGKTEELSFACKGTGLLGLDTLGMIFLSITSLLFLIVSIHTLFWLPAEEAVDQDRVHNGTAHESGLLREHIFLPCLLAFTVVPRTMFPIPPPKRTASAQTTPLSLLSLLSTTMP